MTVRELLAPFAVGLALALALLWSLEGGNVSVEVARAVAEADVEAPNTSAAELHVCPAGPPTCDYDSVQEAVGDADPGDVIKVATGVYTGVSTVGDVTQMVYVDESVTIQGGYTIADWNVSDPEANPTTLDAEGQGRVFYIINAPVVVIEGLRITGGDATGSMSQGGGIYGRISGVTLSGNIIFSNTADYGGGLFLNESTLACDGNTISANTAITHGGGLLLFRSDNATLSGNTVVANVAGYGGGLYLDKSDATLKNNVVADNLAGAAGGGLYVKASAPRLLHTTVTRNSGSSGIYVMGGSDVEMVNTILVSHTVGIGVAAGDAASLNATLWHANTANWVGDVAHTNDRNGPPKFVAPDAGDYHIGDTSAALDTGVDAGIAVDVDGELRPRGNGYDIGADEFPNLLSVVKRVNPVPVRAGAQLTYTIQVVNLSDTGVTAAITDVLPDSVTPTGVLTWTSQVIGSGSTWMQSIIVTVVETGCGGLLTNTVEVTTDEGEVGAFRLVVGCYAVHLPLVLRDY